MKDRAVGIVTLAAALVMTSCGGDAGSALVEASAPASADALAESVEVGGVGGQTTEGAATSSWVSLCKDDSLRQCRDYTPSDGVILDLNNDMNDRVSSLEFSAPRSVDLWLCEHRSNDGYGDCVYVTGTGSYSPIVISKGDLRSVGLHDEISSIVWYENGDLMRAPAASQTLPRLLLFESDGYQGTPYEYEFDHPMGSSTCCVAFNISSSSRIHDDTSSLILDNANVRVGGGRVAVWVCKHHTDDYAGKGGGPGGQVCFKVSGNGDTVAYDKRDLQAVGLHDEISLIVWQWDGKPAHPFSSLNIPAGVSVSEGLATDWSMVRASAIPSNAIPSNAIPSNAIPSNAIPSNAIPSNAIPSNAIPSN